MSYRAKLLLTQWLFDIAGPIHITGAAVLLPFIQAEFDVARSTVVWVTVIYTMSTAASMLPSAYLGNNLGRRKMVILGVSLDMVSQTGVFLAPDLSWLIPVRMVGGIGNALVVANLQPITVMAFPAEKRGQALGLIGVGLGFGILITTVVAGVVADTLGWRYVFAITAAMYGVLLISAIFVVRESPAFHQTHLSLRSFDYGGVALVATFLASLTLSMQRFSTSSGVVTGIALLAVAAAAMTGFIMVQRRSHHPLIDLKLFRSQAFSLSVARHLSVSMLNASHNFLLPFYLIQGLGWSGSLAGSVLVTLNLGRPLMAYLGGYLIDRVGQVRPILTASALLIAGGALLMTMGQDPSVGRVVLGLVVTGMGFGLFMPPNQKVIYEAVPPDKLSLAPGVLTLAGHGSNTVGAAMAATVLALFLQDSIPVAYQQAMAVILGGFVIVTVFLSLLLLRYQPRARVARAQ